MKIMAVDLGRVRTGLAISDQTEFLATPIGTVTERDRDRLLVYVAAAVREHGAEKIVVGLPKNMDGSQGESAQNATAFAEQLQQMTGLPVVLWDERLTTASAIGFLNETNVRGKKRKAVVDAVAAVIILENYLQRRRLQK